LFTWLYKSEGIRRLIQQHQAWVFVIKIVRTSRKRSQQQVISNKPTTSYRKSREPSGPHGLQLRSPGSAHAPPRDTGRPPRMTLGRTAQMGREDGDIFGGAPPEGSRCPRPARFSDRVLVGASRPWVPRAIRLRPAHGFAQRRAWWRACHGGGELWLPATGVLRACTRGPQSSVRRGSPWSGCTAGARRCSPCPGKATATATRRAEGVDGTGRCAFGITENLN